MSTLTAIKLNRIATIYCTGKKSLVEKEIIRRAEISIVCREIIASLEARLTHAGIGFRFIVRNAMTGSVYLKIAVCGDDGRKLPKLGACVRISDHGEKESGMTDFSRPSQRYFGISVSASKRQIDCKVERVVGGIVQRYEKADAMIDAVVEV